MTHQAGHAPRDLRVTVFCGLSEDIGQTTTVLGTAGAMAASGLRVLVVVVRSADRSAVRRLRERLGGRAVGSPRPDGPEGLPAPRRWEVRAGGDPAPLWLLVLPDAAALSRLPTVREAATARLYEGFDRVLVDAPVPRTTSQVMTLSPLGHVLAACFAPVSWSVDAAAALARDMRARSDRPMDVVAVGVHADSRLSEQVRLARDQVRSAFHDLGASGAAPYVEIPHDQDRAQPEDGSAGPGTGPAPAGLARLAEALDRPGAGGVRQVTVVHPHRFRAWAEWIGAQAAAAGTPCTAVPLTAFTGEGPPRGGLLLVLSPTGATPEQTDLLARASHPDTRIVLVDDEPLGPRLAHHEQVDLRGVGEAEAAARLARVLRLRSGLRPRHPGRPAGRAPFPRLPAHHNLMRRNRAFIGRDALCDEVRDCFASVDARSWTCRVTGPPGIGKSALALEYGHRFGSGYDIVWWLSAADAGEIRRGLVRLAERRGIPQRPSAAAEVVDWLQRTEDRWLLVYDDADDPAVLEGLVPPVGEGHHVLVTSRDGNPAVCPSVVVPPLPPGESRALLTAAVPDLPEDRADRIGETLGRTPLNMRLAGAWVSAEAERGEADNLPRQRALSEAAGRLLSACNDVQRELLARERRAPLHRVMLEVALDGLARSAGGALWARTAGDGGALVWLLECCALLTPKGADLAVLHSPALWAAMTARAGGEATAGSAGLPDPDMIDVALWALARQRLISLRFDPPQRAGGGSPGESVRQVRVLRELVLERMAPADRARRESEVRGALAGAYLAQARPGGPPDRTRLLIALRAWTDERPEVRRALVRYIGRLVAAGERHAWEEGLEIADLAAAAWRADPLSPEYLRLHNLRATARRNLERYAEAARDALVALRGHRTALGVEHPRALLSADSYGAILRAEGELSEARIEAHGVLRSMTGVLGPDHPKTVQTEHNLALAEALSGHPAAALELLRARWSRRLAIGGTGDRGALALIDTLAMVHRALGQNRESYNLLKQFLRHTGGRTDTRSLSVEIGLAVSERRLGEPKWALERDRRVLEECRGRFGDRQHRTERCRFSLAADLHAVDAHEAAVETSRRCWEDLGRSLGEDHPYTQLSAIRLGVHLRGAGAREEALAVGRDALAGMTERVGPEHPWAVAAGASLAATLVACGQYDEAYERESEALEALGNLGMVRHPDHVLVARNRADTDACRNGRVRTAWQQTGHDDIDLELPGL